MFRLDEASKIYRHKDQMVVALQPTTLTIAPGDFVAIVGPSGSGKSTLLTMLGGMHAPTGGKVWLDEVSLYDLSVVERARSRLSKMGFVFQSFNLVPYLSAQENVAVPLMLRGTPRRERQRRAVEMLDRFGLADRARHKPSELSTGQQQRVALARTLINDPPVILADEPTGNLDPATRNLVIGYFEEFHRSGKTIVMVTHDPQAAQRASRKLEMADGSVRGHAHLVQQVA